MYKQQFTVYQFNKNKHWWISCLANFFLVVCFIIAFILITFSSITTECVVVGVSMVPTYNADAKSDNDIVFVNKYDNDYEFGDVVVINIEGSSPIIKRVIGVGGDVIDIVLTEWGYKLEINGTIIDEDYINYKYNVTDVVKQNGMQDYYKMFNGDTKIHFPELFDQEGKIVVPENQYFVLGDNRHESKDSMYYGTFTKEDIIGTVEHSLSGDGSKFVFFCEYIFGGKIIKSIVNCFN